MRLSLSVNLHFPLFLGTFPSPACLKRNPWLRAWLCGATPSRIFRVPTEIQVCTAFCGTHGLLQRPEDDPSQNFLADLSGLASSLVLPAQELHFLAKENIFWSRSKPDHRRRGGFPGLLPCPPEKMLTGLIKSILLWPFLLTAFSLPQPPGNPPSSTPSPRLGWLLP